MPINLKPILDSQTDNEKLDAVNYNFDQIVSNGGGPMGYQGAVGSQGLDGLTGAQGSQGVQGFQGRQGPQGVSAENFWIKNQGINNDTLVPAHEGGLLNPPTVMFGIDTLDPLYNQVVDTTSVLINRKSGTYTNNLELTDDAVTATDGNKIFYTLKLEGGQTVYEMGFANNTSALPSTWKLFSNQFNFSDGVNNFMALSTNALTVYVPAFFSASVNFLSTVRIASGLPGVGKILTSTDTSGTVAWKSTSEISGLVPIGTIVPIVTSAFDSNTNFYKDAINGSPLAAGEVLKVRHGAGKDKYAGWYLCNGKVWTNGAGISTDVPDLVSFDYAIDARTGGTAQNAASVTNNKLSLLSGVNMSFNADYSTGSNYDLSYTVTNDVDNIYIAGSGTAYDLTKLVYIIYLGNEGLYWSDSGVAGTTITHYYGLISYKSTSNASSGNYTFTVGTTYTLTGIQGSSQIFTITMTPSLGYSFTSTSNVALYTAGAIHTTYAIDTSVTQTSAAINGSGQLVLTLTDSDLQNTGSSTSYLQFVGNAVASSTGTGISVSRSTSGFSGTSSSAWSSQTVYISSSENNLSDATQLYGSSAMNTSPIAGWYAQNISTGWCYRYWNGSGFSSINMTGISNSPGSWYDISTTNAAAIGTVGQIMYSSASYNACNSTTNPNDIATTKIWATTSDLDSLTSGQTHWAVGVASGSHAPVNFTDAGSSYGSGYISVSPCFRLLGYQFSTGKVTRQGVSCVEYSSSYDNVGGGGYCTSYSSGPSGPSGGSWSSFY
jgi:hypothetical protein